MNYCPDCKEPYEKETKFCQVCGCNFEVDLVTKSVRPKCVKCGKEFSDGVNFCPDDGGRVTTEIQHEKELKPKYENQNNLIFPSAKSKSPFIAAFLSFLWGGLGQVYLGQTALGITIMVIDVFAMFITLGVGYFVIMIVSIVLAYKDAKTLESGNPIHAWPWGFASWSKPVKRIN